MKHYLLLLVLTYQTVYSQIKIVDSQNGSPIAFAHVILKNAVIGTSSNLNGEIVLKDFAKSNIDDSEILTIQHIAYDNFEITFGELKNNATIRLNERTILLNEVTVGSNQKTDYIVLKGFYRSYQLNNNTLKYYTDGIVEYFIPVKSNDFSFKLLEYRSFRNKKLLESKRNSSVSFEMVTAGVPYIEAGVLLNEIKSRYTINDLGDNKAILVSNTKIGYIQENLINKSLLISIDKIAPKPEKVYSFFGNTSRIQNILITENYKSTDFNLLSKDQLESRKEYRKLYFKSKKDIAEELIESVHEFYTFKVSYITKKQFKTIKTEKHTGLRESNSYSSEYWKEIVQLYHLPPLNSQIENELNNSLIMF